MPVCFLRYRLKAVGSEKQRRSAISYTIDVECFSRILASMTVVRLIQSMTDIPDCWRTTALRWFGVSASRSI